MDYTLNRLLTGVSFAEADARTRKALGDSGFGILTEIDVAAKRGFVSLTPVTPIAPEPEPPRDEPVEIGVDIGGENAGKRRKRR